MLEVERNPMPGGGFVSTSTDITERKRTEARMLHLAQHDSLTGLPNRLLFHDRLRQAMARCRREGGLLAVVLLDLDKFKQVNDAFGHRVGDDVLQADRRCACARALRESDTVARIGGDEFALILPDLPDPDGGDHDRRQDRRASSSRPFELDARASGSRAPASGIALFPERWRRAPSSCCRTPIWRCTAPRLRAAAAQLFAAAIKRDFDHRQNLKHDLARAIARGQLSLEYQPQLDLRPERISGVEALLRWHHPSFGPIDPETLIQARRGERPDRHGRAMGAARGLRASPPAGAGEPAPIRLAVNVSASQLASPDFVAAGRAGSSTTSGLPAERLELELTETAMLHEVERVTASLEALHEHGRVAGARRLRHRLRQPQPPQALPARSRSRSTARSSPTSRDGARDAAIVRSLIELGHRLGLRVVAEGVETERAARRAARVSAATRSRATSVGHPLAARRDRPLAGRADRGRLARRRRPTQARLQATGQADAGVACQRAQS